MNIDPMWVFGLAISVLGFFIVRLISKNDDTLIKIDKKISEVNARTNEHIKMIDEKIDKLRDRLINQREKQAVHEAKVDQELLQAEKNIEICLTELKTLHQLQMDVNNIGHKVRKIEDKT